MATAGDSIVWEVPDKIPGVGRGMPTLQCLCCSWKGESHRYPNHAVTRHPEAIQFCRTQFDHCAYVFIKQGAKEIEFAVCQTCHKGTVSDPSTGNGSRWLSLHAKSAACKAAHAGAFSAFRDHCKKAVEAIIPLTQSAASEPAGVVTPTTLTSIWESCRTNKHTKDLISEIEARMKVIHDLDVDEEDPSDSIEYVFDPVEGFQQIAIHANSYKKEFTRTKQEMQMALEKHDRELIEHRRAIMDQRTVMSNQHHEIKDLREEMTAYRQENQSLRDEIQKYQQELELLRKQIAGKKE